MQSKGKSVKNGGDKQNKTGETVKNRGDKQGEMVQNRERKRGK